jgi:hypothetical protein
MYSARQNLLIRSLLAISSKLGQWSRTADSEGAAYVEEALNAAKAGGFACRNCAFWKAPNGCAIVKGPVQPQGLCRFHVIPAARLAQPSKPVSGLPRSRISGETL